MSSGSCPHCGAQDWVETIEHQQVKYMRCGNCKWTPLVDKAETVNAKEWIEEIQTAYNAAYQEFEVAEEAYQKRETTLTMGKRNRAMRLLQLATKRLEIADKVSHIVETTPSGQATLLLPEIGLYQFEWGDFNLFKVIGHAQET